MSFVQVRCVKCGGLLAADRDTVVSSCPFCRNSFSVSDGERYFSETVDIIGDLVTVSDMPVSSDCFDILRGVLYRYSGEAQDVTVPSGVRVIGTNEHNGFFEDVSVTAVHLPDTVKTISAHAFSGCASLERIDMSSVVSIGEGAFEGCSQLADAELPKGIREIKERSFYGCRSLRNVKIPDGVREIGSFAFKECTDMETLSLNEGLEVIGIHAFEKCRRLKRIYFPDSLLKIESGAFDGCESLEEVYIGAQTNIGRDSFSGCMRLLKIEYEKRSQYLDAFPSYKSMMEKRRANNRCEFCGGELKGIVRKVCVSCGREQI